MKYFDHARAASLEEASELMKSENTVAIAGGTDLLSILKTEILEEYPRNVVDLKTIKGADEIKVEENVLKIGAMAKLSRVVESDEVQKQVPMLAEAAKSVATPLIRNQATIGGNICQDTRCWFYRYPQEAGGRLVCSRKCGDKCYAILGDNRYHSVFGGMKTQLTPCSRNCPANTDIPAYMEQLRLGNIPGAAQIIMKANPMPVITSRICAHFCQDECNHKDNGGESSSIRNVERFVGDYILDHKNMFYKAPAYSTGKKVAIIGAGPSGLAAAYYLRGAGNDVTVYDSKPEPGGMLMYAIPAYRLPKDIVRRFTAALADMGIKFVGNTRIGDKIKPADLEKDYDSVFYATGAWKRPVLGLSGEDLTVFGLDFLVQVHDWMEGKVGKEVLVTGGGNVAMDVAVTAKRLGAKKVIMACLESEDIMPASREEIARAREEGIEIMPSWGLSKVISKDGRVTGMELVRCTSVFDEKHRFSPQYDQSNKIVVNAENILMAVGQKVDLSFLDKYDIKLSNRGLIDVDVDTQMTSRPGIFAGGDATTGPKTVIQGIANGRNAARSMNRYLGLTPEHECVGMQIQKPFLTFDLEGVKKARGLKLDEIPASQRNIDVEDEIAPNLEQALEEAKRCMNCGCYTVESSDITPVLVALDATIKTTKRELKAAEFCCEKLKVSDVLEKGELVTEIDIPLIKGAVMHYDKFRLRESVDFAIASLASIFGTKNGKITGAKIVLGGVAPIPLRMNEVEGFLVGKEINEQTANEAGEIAVKNAFTMQNNKYKLQEIKVLISKAILRLA